MGSERLLEELDAARRAAADDVATFLIRQVRPRSWGLFSRAGLESGAMGDWASVTLAEAEKAFARLLGKARAAHSTSPSRDFTSPTRDRLPNLAGELHRRGLARGLPPCGRCGRPRSRGTIPPRATSHLTSDLGAGGRRG